VLFCDAVGSTDLGEQYDPELLQHAMTRYFETVASVIEQHGGTVEKFIGDAVMAIFGVPSVHEDDALRAVRAALQIQRTLRELSDELAQSYGMQLLARVGVNTGEVVVADSPTGALATGMAVNMAARLEQAAAPGEVLLSESTWRLVRDLVDAEPLEPMAVKGRTEPVKALRLHAVAGPTDPHPSSPQGLHSPLVGRGDEEELLHRALDRCVARRTCHLFTVLGAAGVGKSRLLDDFTAGLDPAMTLLRGRCLSYGEGVTLWPIRELIRGWAGVTDVPDEAKSRIMLSDMLAELFAGDSDEPLLTSALGALAGFGQELPPAERARWALRRWVRTLAQQGALVLAIHDLHWAEPAFLDLVEELAELTQDVPVLVLCSARPELFDDRPGWGGGKFNSSTLLLEELTDDDAAQLVTNLVGGAEIPEGTRRQILDAAGGNPLFVEQVLAMLVDDGVLAHGRSGWRVTGGGVAGSEVPDTIRSVLAARLDRLGSRERSVIEAAAVAGETSYVGAVAELTGVGRDEAGRLLLSLVRKELIRSVPSELAGEDAFRFRHALVRDSAYRGLTKQRRAELHERLARWLDRSAPGLGEGADELVGYHLAEAARLGEDLRWDSDAIGSLANEAADRLAGAGRRLMATDALASAALLQRASGLLPVDTERRMAVSVDQAQALLRGHRVDAAIDLLDHIELPTDNPLAWRANLLRLRTALDRDDPPSLEECLLVADQAEAAFTSARDDAGLASVHLLRAFVAQSRAQWQQVLEHVRLVTEHAARANDAYLLDQAAFYRYAGYAWGPTPVDEALPQTEIAAAADPVDRGHRARCAAILYAYADEPDRARGSLVVARQMFDGVRAAWALPYLAFATAWTEMTLGDLHAAGDALEDCLGPASRQEFGLSASFALLLADIRLRCSDLAAAQRWLDTGRELASVEDVVVQAEWRGVAALLLSLQGQHVAALDLADEAVSWVMGGDELVNTARILERRAQVRKAAGLASEADEDLRDAATFYARKGDVRDAARLGGTMTGSVH
jgi:class 3 adenylate cyclase